MTIASPIDLEQSIARKYKALRTDMDECTRRRWAAAEMRELGYGGTAIVHRATGLDPQKYGLHGNRNFELLCLASRGKCVVPFSMELFPSEKQLVKFLFRHHDAFFVRIRVKFAQYL